MKWLWEGGKGNGVGKEEIGNGERGKVVFLGKKNEGKTFK